MSKFYKYGDFQKEVDFTDADFLDAVAEAREKMVKGYASVDQNVEKETDIIRRCNELMDGFFADVLGADAPGLMFGKSQSSMKRAEATNIFKLLEEEQIEEARKLTDAFRVNKDRR